MERRFGLADDERQVMTNIHRSYTRVPERKGSCCALRDKNEENEPQRLSGPSQRGASTSFDAFFLRNLLDLSVHPPCILTVILLITLLASSNFLAAVIPVRISVSEDIADKPTEERNLATLARSLSEERERSVLKRRKKLLLLRSTIDLKQGFLPPQGSKTSGLLRRRKRRGRVRWGIGSIRFLIRAVS